MRPFKLVPVVLGLLLATGTAVASGDFHRDGYRGPASSFGFFLRFDDGRGRFHHQGYRFYRPPHFRYDRDRRDGRRFHGGRDFRHGHRLKHRDPHWKDDGHRWKRDRRHWDRHPGGQRHDRPARLRFRYD